MEDKQNKLDHFLRRHLYDASENQSWNVPDDAIFEKAMRAVANEKKKNRRPWILIPLFLLSGLVINEFLHNRQIEILEGKIHNLEDSLAIESQDHDLNASSAQNAKAGGSTSPSTASNGNEYKNATTSADVSPSSAVATSIATPSAASNTNASSSSAASNPKVAISASPLNSSNASSAKAQNTNDVITSAKPTSTQTDNTALQTEKSTSNIGQANTLTTPSGSAQTILDDPSDNETNNPSAQRESTAADFIGTDIPGTTIASHWMTAPLTSLELKGLEVEASLPLVLISMPAHQESLVQIKSLSTPTMRYGILVGANQSWLTMRNIPPTGDAYLYNYDNSQPGMDLYGFVTKPISSKFSLQAGLGYHVYNNRSILEDQFLFDPDQVTQMPNGESMYQTDIDLINPIGEYNMPLEFRVSDQMEEEDVMVEYTTIEQTLQSVMLDLGLQYTVFTVSDFSVSLGTGLGLSYRSGLKNKFNVSTYHNDILQNTQTDAPDHLNSVRSWYVQWLGNINLEYRMSNRFGLILASQYNAGLSSIRNGNNGSGPLTFIHAFSLSGGVTHSF